MLDYYFRPLKYKEYNGLNNSNQPIYKEETTVLGLRLRGRLTVTHTESGDTTESSVVYKTKEKLVPQSLLEGREIADCVKVEGLGFDCGYMSYLK